MKALELQVHLHSYWHAGTGRGDGKRADAVVATNRVGLPYLPGRTLKGLLRFATATASTIGVVRDETASLWFGTELAGRVDRAADLEGERRYATRAARLRVSSATLGEAWDAWASSAGQRERSMLFETLSATAIDSTRGVAVDRTLRTIEVAVPMTLTARITGPDEGSWLTELPMVLPLIRSLGSGRTRGLGRVTVEVTG